MEGVSRGQLIHCLVTAGPKHVYKISVFVSVIRHFCVRDNSDVSLFNFIIAICQKGTLLQMPEPSGCNRGSAIFRRGRLRR